MRATVAKKLNKLALLTMTTQTGRISSWHNPFRMSKTALKRSHHAAGNPWQRHLGLASVRSAVKVILSARDAERKVVQKQKEEPKPALGGFKFKLRDRKKKPEFPVVAEKKTKYRGRVVLLSCVKAGWRYHVPSLDATGECFQSEDSAFLEGCATLDRSFKK